MLRGYRLSKMHEQYIFIYYTYQLKIIVQVMNVQSW